MQKTIPMAKAAYMKAASVSTYEKQFNKVADAIKEAVDNGELCCEVFLSSIMDKKLRSILEKTGYSIYSIERADSSQPSIYTISWTAKEINMIDICVFGNYKVKLHNKYSYISDYDHEMKESIFSEDVEEWEKVMDGGELMHIVAKLMLENDTITFECKNLSVENGEPVGEIIIEKFEPQDGTGGTITINYGAIK